MNRLSFNLNNHIRVKLKPEGVALWKADHDQTFSGPLATHRKPLEHYEAQADAEGYTRFQAWEFMRLFGSHIVFGGHQPFDLNILIEYAETTE